MFYPGKNSGKNAWIRASRTHPIDRGSVSSCRPLLHPTAQSPGSQRARDLRHPRRVMSKQSNRSLSLLLVPGLMFLGGLATAQQAKPRAKPPEHPHIVAPDKSVLGKSYSEWSAAWWKWSLELPCLANHPGNCSPSYDVTLGQTGDVWFLAGPFGPCFRTARIPAGKWLFLPMANVEASSLESAPFYGCTPAEQAAAAKSFADAIRRPFVEVDGLRLPQPERFRFVSPQFTATLPVPNCIGVPAGTTTNCPYAPVPPPMEATSVSDGYWAMIDPLPVGDHLIRFGGEFILGGISLGEVDTTYFLTVY